MTAARILFVDDEPVIGELVCDVLEEEGFDLVCLRSGEEAVAEIEAHDDFDAIITDIDLGGRVDGFAIARLAREHCPDAAVIYLSGAAAARLPAERVAGARFVGKPFTPYKILDILRQMLRDAVRRA